MNFPIINIHYKYLNKSTKQKSFNYVIDFIAMFIIITYTSHMNEKGERDEPF